MAEGKKEDKDAHPAGPAEKEILIFEKEILIFAGLYMKTCIALSLTG